MPSFRRDGRERLRDRKSAEQRGDERRGQLRLLGLLLHLGAALALGRRRGRRRDGPLHALAEDGRRRSSPASCPAAGMRGGTMRRRLACQQLTLAGAAMCAYSTHY